MMQIWKAEDRGSFKLDWLDSKHSFSFGEYYAPEKKGFNQLRVINEDTIAGGLEGFDFHPHFNMEIITYPISGSLKHKDSEGNSYTIQADEVQRISSGTGILHSEHNASVTEDAHFLQIWVKPLTKGGEPSYAHKKFSRESKLNQLKLIASQNGNEDSISIKQDMNICASILEANNKLEYQINKGAAWIQLIEGALTVLSSYKLEPGDGLAIDSNEKLELEAKDKETHFLLFDMQNDKCYS